jgi:hypothetical protein
VGTVTAEYSFDELQEALIEFLDSLEANLDEIMKEISPHELSGKMGYSNSPIEGYDLTELNREGSKLIQRYREEVENADDTADLLIAFGQVADDHREPEIESDDQLPVPDSILEGIVYYSGFLDYVSEESPYDFKNAAEEFIIELYRQDLLSTACRAMITYFLSDENIPINYANTAMTDISDLYHSIQEVDDHSEFKIQDSVDKYRRCSIYYETALPPFLTLIDVLKEEEPELEEIRKMQLSNAVSKVRNFQPLQVFVRDFDTNIRNAVDHGGISGYNPDPKREVVEFNYKVGGETISEEMSYNEFKETTLSVCKAAIALYGLPMYIILAYPHLLILDEYDELELR